MKDRLLKFLTREQLSSARFAETIGVQPSSISHILSGRNKPGFDFIYKTLSSYPSLNAEWLITGKGSMYKSEIIQGDLFSARPAGELSGGDMSPDYSDRSEDGYATTEDNITGDQAVLPDEGITSVTKPSSDLVDKSKSASSVDDTNVNSSRYVERIVIFYSDKKFSEYFP